MFKLLIADDEKLERDSLRFIISKSIDSIGEIEEAVNGREAIMKAGIMNPDIIILDINMPGINGIEAAWKIREEYKSACIIFLTAFHQFDYAHEAIKVGADDYIVKPSSEKRIIEVLERVTSKLIGKQEKNQKQKNMERRLDRVTDYLSSEFIYLLSTRILDEEKFRNYLTLLDLNFHKGRGVVLKLNYDSYPIGTSDEYQKQILKKKSLRRIKAQLNHYDIYCSFNMDLNNTLILIYSDRYNGVLESDESLERAIQSISDNIKEELNIEVFLGFGSLFDSGEKANQSFNEAKKNLSDSMGGTSLSHWGDGFPIGLEMDLEQALLGSDEESLNDHFIKMEKWVLESQRSFEDMKTIVQELTVILRHSVSLKFPEEECRVDTENISQAPEVNELLSAFKEVLKELIDFTAKLYGRENIPVIKKACKYINENYHREISLEDTAEHCNLSTFYFSKIFKEHKKKNFINYLTEIRIEEAKRLLKETPLTMKEISGMVGYRDPNYFTRVFKRVENCSPRFFRNKIMLKQQ